MWTEKELDENAKELYKLLKSCKYVQQSHKSAVSTDKETSNQIANNIHEQSCDCVCEDTFSCQDSELNVGGIVLDVEEFLKDNIQFEGEKHIHNTIQQHVILFLFLSYIACECVKNYMIKQAILAHKSNTCE